MRYLTAMIFLAVIFAAVPASAKKATAKSAKKSKSDLQTDVRFDDSAVHGQYQIPEEALAKVENEKGLSDLLGVRKHFKDRLTESAEQE